ncbi:MAG: MarR family winged helix-turn-helix transcriptional regulator [Aeromonadaceae bacterium]
MPGSHQQLQLDRQICFALYHASNAIIRAYRPLLEELDLTYPQYLAMLVLWQNEGVSVKQLGEQLHLDSGTLTPLLKRLESKGYVTRGRSEEDERVRVLNLTEQGRMLREQAAKIPASLRGHTTLSDDELLQLKLSCEALSRDFG